jgi:hypothetical protein
MDFPEMSDNIENSYYDIDDDIISNNHDMLLLHYTNDILDIFDNYKERFATNPDFLCKLKGFIFVNFVIDYILHPSSNRIKNNASISENEIFEDVFKNELKISYNIIYQFMKELKVDLSFDNWKTYCQKYSCIPHV